MATPIKLNIITGRTGTAHVSSDDDAAIWRGLVGNSSITLYTDQQLALDYQTKGRLSLSDGVFCILGKMGRVSNASYVEYDLPLPGSCRRTFLLVRYAIDSNGIESMSLLTLQSEDATGSDAATTAAELPITVDKKTDYVLYDFVCDEDGVVSGTMKTKLTVMETIPAIHAALNAEASALSGRVSTLETFKNTETSERKAADTALSGRVSTLETAKTSIDSEIVSIKSKIGSYKFIELTDAQLTYYSQHSAYYIENIPCESGTKVILCLSYGHAMTYVHLAFNNAGISVNGLPYTSSYRNPTSISLSPALIGGKLYFRNVGIAIGNSATNLLYMYETGSLSLESATTWNAGRKGDTCGQIELIAAFQVVNA